MELKGTITASGQLSGSLGYGVIKIEQSGGNGICQMSMAESIIPAVVGESYICTEEGE